MVRKIYADGGWLSSELRAGRVDEEISGWDGLGYLYLLLDLAPFVVLGIAITFLDVLFLG